MQKRKSSILSLFLLAIFVISLLAEGPASAQTPDKVSRTFDDAVLMMLAAHSRLAEGLPDPGTTSSLPGIMSAGKGSYIFLEVLPQRKTTLQRMNEHRVMAETYTRLGYKDGISIAMQNYCTDQANYHNQQADRIDRHRRNRGVLRRFIRRVGVLIGGVLGTGMDLVAQTAQYYIEEEIPSQVRALVQDMLRSPGQRLQQMIDSRWEQLSQQYWYLPVDQLRYHVDRWFVRIRNGLTGRSNQRAKPTATQAAPKGSDKENKPAETKDVIFSEWNGNWTGDECPEKYESFPFKWGVSLVETADGKVVGTVRFHDCPGGGQAIYKVSGNPDETPGQITLQAEKVDGWGARGDSSPASARFLFILEPPHIQEIK